MTVFWRDIPWLASTIFGRSQYSILPRTSWCWGRVATLVLFSLIYGVVCSDFIKVAVHLSSGGPIRPLKRPPAFRKPRNGWSPLTIEEHAKLLVNAVGLSSDVYIIVDAIDSLDGSSTSRKLLPQTLLCLTNNPYFNGVEKAFANKISRLSTMMRKG
jgi:hypothetical protein